MLLGLQQMQPPCSCAASGAEREKIHKGDAGPKARDTVTTWSLVYANLGAEER